MAAKKASWSDLPGIEIVPALLLFGAIVAFGGAYGYFRDEFYYLACARRLAWGYVDQPPLSIALLAATGVHTLVGLKVVAGLIGGLTVYLAGRTARMLGGGSFAAGVTSVCLLCSPMFVGIAGYFSMNGIECLLWVCLTLAMVSALKGHKGAWLVFGVFLGLALLNKYTVGLFAVCALLGVLLSAPKQLKEPSVWVGALIAALMLAPHVYWEMSNHWPTLEFMHNATVVKMAPISPREFFTELLLGLNPFPALLLVVGVLWLFLAKSGRVFMPVGIALIAVLVVLSLAGKVRPSYAIPACVVGLSVAGAACEGILKGRMRWVAAPVLVAGVGIQAIALPMALPVLPPERLIEHLRKLGMTPKSDEKKEPGVFPQFMADRFGWEDLAQQVSVIYQSLSPSEQAQTRIVVGNYGEAGAIEQLAPELRGRIVCGHNNYFLWGTDGWSGRTAILLGDNEKSKGAFTSVKKVGEWDHDYAMPYERHQPVYLCRGGHLTGDRILQDRKSFE